jgi:hypothetical protein
VTFLVGHDPASPPEATLVLAAAAWCNGLLRDGTRGEGFPKAPSMAQLARTLGIHLEAVRRGVTWLVQAGEVTMDRGVHVKAEALRRRWHDDRDVAGRRMPAGWFRCRLEAEQCAVGLSPRALLLTALVAGQIEHRQKGLCLAMPYLAERLGLPLRTTERLAVTCQEAGVLHRVSRGAPGGGCRRLLWWRMGPAPAGATVEKARRAVEKPSSGGGRGGGVVAVGPSSGGGPDIVRWRSGSSSDGGHLPVLPEVPPEVRPGSAREPRGAEPSQEAREAGESARPCTLVGAILRTGLRSKLPPLPRWRFAHQLAEALRGQGMTVDEFERCVARSRRMAGTRDPDGLLVKILAGPWRAELDAERETGEHSAARSRGRATAARERRDGAYGFQEPQSAGDMVAGVLQGLQQPARPAGVG